MRCPLWFLHNGQAHSSFPREELQAEGSEPIRRPAGSSNTPNLQKQSRRRLFSPGRVKTGRRGSDDGRTAEILNPAKEGGILQMISHIYGFIKNRAEVTGSRRGRRRVKVKLIHNEVNRNKQTVKTLMLPPGGWLQYGSENKTLICRYCLLVLVFLSHQRDAK